IAAYFVGPVGRRDRAVRAEHNDQPLSRTRGTGEAETGQPHQKRHRSCREAQLLDKLSAMNGVHKCNSTTDGHGSTRIFEKQIARILANEIEENMQTPHRRRKTRTVSKKANQ